MARRPEAKECVAQLSPTWDRFVRRRLGSLCQVPTMNGFTGVLAFLKKNRLSLSGLVDQITSVD